MLAYSTISYIQNQRHIQNSSIFRVLNDPEEFEEREGEGGNGRGQLILIYRYQSAYCKRNA